MMRKIRILQQSIHKQQHFNPIHVSGMQQVIKDLLSILDNLGPKRARCIFQLGMTYS